MTRISAATPAGYATTVTLPRVYNLAYPGDALTVTATTASSGTPTATAWTVYDYTGTVVATGTWSGQTTTIGTAGSGAFAKYGWYTLKLTGPDVGDGAFGTDGGTCRFVICENFTGIPPAPLRSTNPTGVTSNLDAPLAHGLFSLGGFRTSIVAQKLSMDRQHASGTATGTSVTATLTGGGFNGAVTSASDLFVVHTVVGDSTGMTLSTTGFTLIGTVTKGSVTTKVWRQYGAQTGPYTVTATTTNSASHSIYVTEVQNVDNGATANGQLEFIPFTGTGTSAVISQDMTSVATGTTEYYVLTAVTPDAGTVNNIGSLTNLTPYVGAGAIQGTTDTFGGGHTHSATYTLSTSANWAGFFLAYKAVSTYASDLAAGKAYISQVYSAWAQHQDPNRPYRQMTVQVLGATTSSAVTSYSGAITQTVSDVATWAAANTPGFVAGFTARNEPQGTYSVTEGKAFKTAVAAGYSTAKALGPDYVSLGLNNVGQSDLASKIAGGMYGTGGLDAISFHSYNMCNGDIANTLAINRSLANVLSTGGVSNLATFVTEGGDYTAYTPGILRARAAGTEHILDEMAREVICGIPYERHYYYYDYRTGGYDSVATWSSSPSGPYAGWAMHRAYARELYGKTLARALSFGDQFDKIVLGGLWRNPTDGTGVMAVMACAGVPAITFAVSGNPTSLTAVDCMGNTSTVTVTGGTFSLTVDDRPVYVRLPAGVDCNPRPVKKGVSFLTVGLISKSDSSGDSAATGTNLSKMLDGVYTNTYAYDVGSGTVNSGIEAGDGYFTTTTTFPRTIEFDISQPATVDTAAVYFAAPYQGSGVPLAWSLQYSTDGTTWSTAGSFTVTPVSVKNYDVGSDTMLDAYTNAQHYYEVTLNGGSPVALKGLRLVLTSASLGMWLSANENQPPGATSGAGGTAQVNITEVGLHNLAANVTRPAIA